MLGYHHPSPGETPTWADTPRQQTAAAVDGTHPTGMHSCFIKGILSLISIWKFVSHIHLPQIVEFGLNFTAECNIRQILMSKYITQNIFLHNKRGGGVKIRI